MISIDEVVRSPNGNAAPNWAVGVAPAAPGPEDPRLNPRHTSPSQCGIGPEKAEDPGRGLDNLYDFDLAKLAPLATEPGQPV
jgi:hypothetical protein